MTQSTTCYFKLNVFHTLGVSTNIYICGHNDDRNNRVIRNSYCHSEAQGTCSSSTDIKNCRKSNFITAITTGQGISSPPIVFLT